MKAIIIYSAMLFMVITTTEAQQAQEKQIMRGRDITIGYGFMDVTKMNAFVPENIGKFNNHHLLIGASDYTMRGNFVVSGSAQFIMGNVIKTDSATYRLHGEMVTLNFGYLILNKEKVKIFPMLGIGYKSYGIYINQNKSVSASEIISHPYREINITNRGLVFDASVTMDFIPVFKYHEKTDSYWGFMPGLKIGYIYGLPSSHWKFSGQNVTGGPNFGLNMFYVKLVLGNLRYSKKKVT